MARDTNPGRRKALLRKPKRVTWWIYQIGWAVGMIVGLLVMLIGAFTTKLFNVYIYDQRNPAAFRNIDVYVGYFSNPTSLRSLLGEETRLEHHLHLSGALWIIAQLTCVLGIICAVLSCILHLVASKRHQVPTMIVEGIAILLTVGSTLVSLSLAENQIEVIHDHGDDDLAQLLLRNNLISTSPRRPSTALPPQLLPAGHDNAIAGSAEKALFDTNEFALVVTPTGYSFKLMIAADFLFLLCFLCFLIRFVHALSRPFLISGIILNEFG